MSLCLWTKPCTHEVMVDGFVVYTLNLSGVEGVGDMESRAVESAILVLAEGGVVTVFRARAASVTLRR